MEAYTNKITTKTLTKTAWIVAMLQVVTHADSQDLVVFNNKENFDLLDLNDEVSNI